MCAAHVREACGIPGTSVATAFLCRDKPAMKEVLREAGVPCAQSIGSSDADEIARLRRQQVGFPLIVKPRDAAGASGTLPRRQRRRARARRSRDSRVDQGARVAVEEFIEGHEGFYDTITIERARRPRLRLALLPERARGDAHALDLAAVRHDQPHRRRRPPTTS